MTSDPLVDIDSAKPVVRIGIEAHIDGRDRLAIKGDTMQWHHLSAAAVGRHNGADSPTIISDSLGRNVTEWLPQWATPPPNEIRQRASSSIFEGLPQPLPRDGMAWKLEQTFGRNEVYIVEQPNAANDYTLLVEFWDLQPGSRFYGIELLKVSGSGGDFDHDGDVDREDITFMMLRRNTPATGESDRMDVDQDGQITVIDARAMVLRCTRVRCASE